VKGFEPSTFTLARLERTVTNLQEIAVYDAPDSTLHKRLHKATRVAEAERATGWRVGRDVGDTAARRTALHRWHNSIRPPHGKTSAILRRMTLDA